MNDDAIWLFGVERLAQFDDQLGGQSVERLVRDHDVKVDVRHDPGNLQHLIQQAAMLGRHDDAGFHAGPRAQGVDHREHLDRFGAGAEHYGDLHHQSFLLQSGIAAAVAEKCNHRLNAGGSADAFATPRRMLGRRSCRG